MLWKEPLQLCGLRLKGSYYFYFAFQRIILIFCFLICFFLTIWLKIRLKEYILSSKNQNSNNAIALFDFLRVFLSISWHFHPHCVMISDMLVGEFRRPLKLKQKTLLIFSPIYFILDANTEFLLRYLFLLSCSVGYW